MTVRLSIVVRWCLLIAVAASTTNRAAGTSYGARETSIQSETDQLHNAIQAYKEKYLAYPPCLGDADPVVRKVRFMEHLAAVYPNSAYGRSEADFDNLAGYVSANYKVPTGSGTVSLDLNRLDPAESLVLWLGGLPTPISTGTAGGVPVAPSRLFGFNVDSDSPMKRSLRQEGTDPLATRTNTRFDFRQERLVDNDDDGWWEYVPTPPSTGATIAPFVYFDSATYRRSTTDGRLGTVIYPSDPNLIASFGTVVPFVEAFNHVSPASVKWCNPVSFQIVCGGFDGVYSAATSGARIELFPGGKTFRSPTFAGPPVECDMEELDNFTNLARTTLSGEVPTAGKRWANSFRQIAPEFFVYAFIILIAPFLLRSGKSKGLTTKNCSGQRDTRE
jgi:hypothetical protein